MRAPPSSPYQTKAAIPLYVRPMRGGYAGKPQTYPERPRWDSESQWQDFPGGEWHPLGLGADEKPPKTVHKMFWPALGGVIVAVWFFSRTQQPQK